MFCISLKFNNEPSMWTLLYNDEAKAKTEWVVYCDATMDTPVHLSDDFGQAVVVNRSSISGAMFEDMDKSKLAHIERALHHARMQQEGQKLAAADAQLRAGQHGPSIIAPMGGMNGGFPRN